MKLKDLTLSSMVRKDIFCKIFGLTYKKCPDRDGKGLTDLYELTVPLGSQGYKNALFYKIVLAIT